MITIFFYKKNTLIECCNFTGYKLKRTTSNIQLIKYWHVYTYIISFIQLNLGNLKCSLGHFIEGLLLGAKKYYYRHVHAYFAFNNNEIFR